MPTYLFKCEVCGIETECKLKTTAKVIEFPLCIKCGLTMRRMIAGGTGVRLMGTGWSEDGYACTDRAAEHQALKGDNRGAIKSFPGQVVRNRRR